MTYLGLILKSQMFIHCLKQLANIIQSATFSYQTGYTFFLHEIVIQVIAASVGYKPMHILDVSYRNT